MSGKSSLENLFRLQLAEAELPPHLEQFKAIPGRRYSWDFAFYDHRLLIELQGGVWMAKGGHNTGGGITRDCDKLILATLAGYYSMAFTMEHLKSGKAVESVKKFIALHPKGDNRI